MLNFIERNFFVIVQRLGLLFALLAFAATVVLGIVSYEKISLTATDRIKAPVIEYSKYQNPISVATPQERKVEQPKAQPVLDTFERDFDQAIVQIVDSLNTLGDDVINKADMQNRVKILVKIKSNPYPQSLQLAYAQSLAKLTKQLVNVGGDEINVDRFFSWHDKEFAQQVDAQTQGNILKMSSLKNERMNGFVALGMAAAALGIFIMFVMMLVMLRIERNTRG